MGQKKIVSAGYKPHKLQHEYFMKWKQFNVLVCTRRFGKTVMAISALCKAAMAAPRRKQPPMYGYILPLKTQAEDVTWDIFEEYLAPLVESGDVKLIKHKLEIRFPGNKARIKLYGADGKNRETIRGKYMDGVVLDEVDSMSEDVWSSIVMPMLNDFHGWALICGTVGGEGNLYNFYTKNYSDPRWNVGMYRFSEHWQDIPAYCDYDEENDEYVPSKLKHDLTVNEYSDKPEAFQREYECNFHADIQDMLIPVSTIDAAIRRLYRPENNTHEPIICGVDVAFSEALTADESSITIRQGAGLPVLPWHKRGIDNQDLADEIVRRHTKWGFDAIFIDAGRGEGVISRLRRLGLGDIVIPINFGGTPIDKTKYRMRRDEMWFRARDWLKEYGCIPDYGPLRKDLQIPRFRDEYGKSQLITKQKMKELSGKSPDIGDSFALTFAQQVFSRKGRAGNAIKVEGMFTNKGNNYGTSNSINSRGSGFRSSGRWNR